MTLLARISLMVIAAAFLLLAILATLRLADQRDFARYWRALDTSAHDETFSEALIEDLPAPAQRYFRRAIRPGTPLATSVRLRLHRSHRARTHTDFRATGIISPRRGFVWEGRE